MEFKFKDKINVQSLVLIGCVLTVVYLAMVPLLMLLFNSIRSAPIGYKDAFFTTQNYLEAYVDPKFFPLLKKFLYLWDR